MPEEKSSPVFAANPDYRKFIQFMGDKWFLKPLQVNKYLNRPLASPVVRIFYRTRVTPNELTFLAFVLGLVAAYFLFRGEPASFIVGGILTQISSIIDCSDGMLAKTRGQQSEFGAYLDMFFDRINEFCLMAGYAFGYFRQSRQINFLIYGFIALGLYFLQVSLFYLTKEFLKEGRKADTAEMRGLLLFLIFFTAVINRPDIGIFVLLIATISINIFLVNNIFQAGRKKTARLPEFDPLG